MEDSPTLITQAPPSPTKLKVKEKSGFEKLNQTDKMQFFKNIPLFS